MENNFKNVYETYIDLRDRLITLVSQGQSMLAVFTGKYFEPCEAKVLKTNISLQSNVTKHIAESFTQAKNEACKFPESKEYDIESEAFSLLQGQETTCRKLEELLGNLTEPQPGEE